MGKKLLAKIGERSEQTANFILPLLSSFYVAGYKLQPINESV